MTETWGRRGLAEIQVSVPTPPHISLETGSPLSLVDLSDEDSF